MIYCVICGKTSKKFIRHYVCRICYDQLDDASEHEVFQSLYEYNEDIRSLVTKGKITGHVPSILAVVDLFLHHEKTMAIADEVDAIVVAPSSLWSRLHGKVDLAWILSSELAKKCKKPLEPSPFSLRWRYKKRSKIKNRELLDMTMSTNYDFSKTILFVDDVVTTGYTLKVLSERYSHADYRFLTFSSAIFR